MQFDVLIGRSDIGDVLRIASRATCGTLLDLRCRVAKLTFEFIDTNLRNVGSDAQ